METHGSSELMISIERIPRVSNSRGRAVRLKITPKHGPSTDVGQKHANC